MPGQGYDSTWKITDQLIFSVGIFQKCSLSVRQVKVSPHLSVCRGFSGTESFLLGFQTSSRFRPHSPPVTETSVGLTAPRTLKDTPTLLTARRVPWLLQLMVQMGPPYASTLYRGLSFSRSYSVISPFRPALNRRPPTQHRASTALPLRPGIT